MKAPKRPSLRLSRLQDRLAVQRPPLPVRGPRHVRDHDMCVQVRVLPPRGAMPESRGDKAFAELDPDAIVIVKTGPRD